MKKSVSGVLAAVCVAAASAAPRLEGMSTEQGQSLLATYSAGRAAVCWLILSISGAAASQVVESHLTSCESGVPSTGCAQKTTRPTPPSPFTTDVERCIVPASEVHGVNQEVLRAVLKVESNLNPRAIGQNVNGSIDVGIAQINSRHFKELATFGIQPAHLMDACVGTYVAAWHLRRVIARHGNTWEGIAHYHSGTPHLNRRYQILLTNELIRANALKGAVQAVPLLKAGSR